MKTPTLPPLARPAFKPIMCRDQVIAIGEYYGTSEQGEIVLRALTDYGHLIRSQSVRGTTLRLDFSQFADHIEASSGCDIKAGQETVRVLRAVHELNISKLRPADSSVVADGPICATQVV